MIVANVLQQHADDVVALAANRRSIARHATLERLLRADLRLQSNLDGLRLAGDDAAPFYDAMREGPTGGAMFALTLRTLEHGDQQTLGELIAMVQAMPDTLDGLLSAFGWVTSSILQGTVASLLADSDPSKRMVGIAACAMHRVDPGLVSKRFLQDPEPAVRARAFRTAGELGLAELATTCSAAAGAEEHPEAKFWAAWSSVLLGHRQTAVAALLDTWRSAMTHQERAFRLALQAVSASAAHAMLQTLANDAKDRRWLIQGCGIAGDAAYVPWLVKQMNEMPLARIAGEAFALITGADLGTEALDRPAPAGVDVRPNDDPDDPNVAMDHDDGLTWPDANRVQEWWDRNAERFPRGVRYFMGAPVTRERCIDILKNGYQLQRILAAHHLCLLEPGTPLFNTSAPAWRQQRWLAKLA